MSNRHNTTVELMKWLYAGSSTEVLIKKILLISAAILIIYRLGYAIGKLLFHFGL